MTSFAPSNEIALAPRLLSGGLRIARIAINHE